MILTLQDQFSSAHFYVQKAWDEEANRKAFGACYTPYGHGHNYKVKVCFNSSLEFLSRDEKHFAGILRQVCAALDHQHLNFDIPAFKDKNPTTEQIALYIIDQLQAKLPKNSLKSVSLYEMDDLWVEIQV